MLFQKENRQTVQPEPSASNVQEKQDVEQQEEPQKVEPPPPNPIVEEQAVGATEQQRTLSVAQRFPPIDRTRGWSFTVRVPLKNLNLNRFVSDSGSYKRRTSIICSCRR